MADLEKQLAELENDIIASEKPQAPQQPQQPQQQVQQQGGIAKYLSTKKVGVPNYFYGILAAIPVLIIGILYFLKPKMIYRRKKFIVAEYAKLTILATIALWVLVGAVMYFMGYISTN